MATYPNIYPNVVMDLHPRLKEVLLQFGREGQIDCDAVGYPYLISVRNIGPRGVEARVSRNGILSSIIMNPRARTQKPELSWDPNDGFRARTKVAQVGAQSRGERRMRESENPYTGLVEALLEKTDVPRS